VKCNRAGVLTLQQAVLFRSFTGLLIQCPESIPGSPISHIQLSKAYQENNGQVNMNIRFNPNTGGG